MEPIFAIITDTHLEDGNEQQVVDIFKETREICLQKGLVRCYHAGDVFNNRKYQTQSTLRALDDILIDSEKDSFEWRVVPGNHDKADYESSNSYLDVYRKFPSLKLVTDRDFFIEGPFCVYMVPFFTEKTSYRTHFNKVKTAPGDRNVLITHVAINGVRNNDGTIMSDVLPVSLFKDFESVLVGHYHDNQQFDNVHYIGSTHQHTFGEDRRKGVSFIYEDGSIEQIELQCVKKYNVVKIDLENTSQEQIKQLVEESELDQNVRFKFTGSKDKFKTINQQEIKQLGIDVKFEQSEIDVDLSYVGKKDFQAFNTDDIIANWKPFCKHKNVEKDLLDLGQGILNKQLKK